MAFNFSILSTTALSLALFGGSFLLWLKNRDLTCLIMMLSFFVILVSRALGAFFSFRLASGNPIDGTYFVRTILQISQYSTIAASFIAAGAFVIFTYNYKKAGYAP